MRINAFHAAAGSLATLLSASPLSVHAQTVEAPASMLHFVDPELRPILAIVPTATVDAGNIAAVRSGPTPAALAAPAPQPLEQFIESDGNRSLRLMTIDPLPQHGDKPVVLHFHGGGFVAGEPEIVLPDMQRLATELGAFVVSVDYRLAPEHPYPAALNDALAALRWIHASADRLGLDRQRVALLGESAGAGLAATLSLAARGENLPIRFQALRYPMLDDRTVLRRQPAHVGSFIWTAGSNTFGWTSLLGGKPTFESAPAGAVPARATDLSGLPSTWIGVGTLDLFAQEDIAFGARLMEAGISVEMIVVPGAYHGFDIMTEDAKASRAFRESWKGALEEAFGEPAGSVQATAR